MAEPPLNYVIRAAHTSELPQVLVLTEGEGWGQTLEYLQDCLEWYPEAFTVAVNDDGEVIANCALSPTGEKYAYLGSYVVKKGYRGQGVGSKVYRYATARMEGRSIYLAAKLSNVPLYKSIGYKTVGWRVLMTTAVVSKLSPGPTPCDVTVVNITEVDWNYLLSFDSSIHSLPREDFLKIWLRPTRSLTMCAVKKQVVVGYGSVRKTEYGYRLCALYSENEATAQLLMTSLLNSREKQFSNNVKFSVPFENTCALKVLKRIGVCVNIEDVEYRMCRGQHDFRFPLRKVYNISNSTISLI